LKAEDLRAIFVFFLKEQEPALCVCVCVCALNDLRAADLRALFVIVLIFLLKKTGACTMI
jgi:hypothetical protein